MTAFRPAPLEPGRGTPGHNVAVLVGPTASDPRALFAAHGVPVERLSPVPGGYLASFKQPADPGLAAKLDKGSK